MRTVVSDFIFFLFAILQGWVDSKWIGHHHKQAEIFCPDLRDPRHGAVSCHHRGSRVPCRKVPIGTVADYECEYNYVGEPVRIIQCLANGTWNSKLPVCVPDCGKQNPFVSLITNGVVAAPGTFPWQVAIYNHLEDGYEFWCGGSLISEYLVITAAHCAWKIPAKNLVAAFAKFFRSFDAVEDNAQKIKPGSCKAEIRHGDLNTWLAGSVFWDGCGHLSHIIPLESLCSVMQVEMLRSYQDVGGNYNGDLSVMFLERAVKINALVRPICIDWNQEHMDQQLLDGNLGTVLGWGLTENDTFSEVLRSVQLPVKSDEDCIAQQHNDFRKFVTYTSFCAGFRNGSGVCNGDSGGGLAFLDWKTDSWYLQGVVSVSPRRRGTSYCDPNFYTVFTKVTTFVKWLLKIKELEEELVTSGVIGPGDDASVNEVPQVHVS